MLASAWIASRRSPVRVRLAPLRNLCYGGGSSGDNLKVRGLLYAAGKHVALDVDASVTPVGEELQIEATALVDQRRSA